MKIRAAHPTFAPPSSSAPRSETFAAQYDTHGPYAWAMERDIYKAVAAAGMKAQQARIEQTNGSNLLNGSFELHASGTAAQIQKLQAQFRAQVTQKWATACDIEIT